MTYARHSITEDDVEAVCAALRGEKLTQGDEGPLFEEALRERLSASHVVACSSGSAALTLAYEAIGLGAGHEVILPANTFVATAAAAAHLGATVVPVDIEYETGLIDPNAIVKAITPRTRAVVVQHHGGAPCQMSAIRYICNQRKLWLIDDAAHALGSEYGGRPIGSDGITDLTTFSFHPAKAITTGEGGAIATHSEELADTMRRLRSHGGDNRHGYNFRLSDIQCALGRSQLKRLDSHIERRREWYDVYREMLPMVEQDNYGVSSCHLAQVQLTGYRAFSLRERLGTPVHYKALTGPYSKACEFALHTATLPLHVHMTEKDVQDVCSLVNEYL